VHSGFELKFDDVKDFLNTSATVAVTIWAVLSVLVTLLLTSRSRTDIVFSLESRLVALLTAGNALLFTAFLALYHLMPAQIAAVYRGLLPFAVYAIEATVAIPIIAYVFTNNGTSWWQRGIMAAMLLFVASLPAVFFLVSVPRILDSLTVTVSYIMSSILGGVFLMALGIAIAVTDAVRTNPRAGRNVSD